MLLLASCWPVPDGTYFRNKIHLKKVPIFWRKQTPFPAMAYYLALEHGKGAQLYLAIFDAHFELDLEVFDPHILNQGLAEHSIPVTIKGKDWTQSKRLIEKVQKGLELAEKYDIHKTPTILINKAIKVAPDHVKGDMKSMLQRVEEIIVELWGNN